MQREKESKSLQQWSLVLPHQRGPAQFHGQQYTLIPVSVLRMKPSNKLLSLLASPSLLDIPDIKVIFFSLRQNSQICQTAAWLHPKVHTKRENNSPTPLKQDW